jgi:hypothetical protein
LKLFSKIDMKNTEIKLKQKNIHGITTNNNPGKYIVCISVVMTWCAINTAFFSHWIPWTKSTNSMLQIKWLHHASRFRYKTYIAFRILQNNDAYAPLILINVVNFCSQTSQASERTYFSTFDVDVYNDDDDGDDDVNNSNNKSNNNNNNEYIYIYIYIYLCVIHRRALKICKVFTAAHLE